MIKSAGVQLEIGQRNREALLCPQSYQTFQEHKKALELTGPSG